MGANLRLQCWSLTVHIRLLENIGECYNDVEILSGFAGSPSSAKREII